MNSVTTRFTPNRLTYAQGLDRIKEAAQAARVDVNARIWTSKDPEMSALRRRLATDNVPEGFEKWQLPFALDRAQLFISRVGPNARVPKHSHAEGDGIRFIAEGSITFNGVILEQGDWMFIPKNKEYSFEVGSAGASFFYCYSCCCA